MTIKRRLFVSNILMIALPMLLTIITGLVLFFLFIGITGIDLYSMSSERISYMDENSAHELMLKEEYSVVADDVVIYKSNTGNYIVTVPENANIPNSQGVFENNIFISLLILLLLLTIVFFTNHALTRFVFRSVVTPIETLVGGVHEIRDGNLTYRIQYGKNDEFAAVCADFNEMAARLLDMVTQRQKDESNRRELIAGISHDLRTPLTSIKGYIEGIEKGVAVTPQMQKKYLDIIKNNANDMEYILNQLFQFSKLDMGEFPFHLERVDIGKEINEMVTGFSDEYKEKGLTVSLTENVWNVFSIIDTVQFRNVIHNLLGNSLKYGNLEQTIAEVSCLDADNSVIRPSLKSPKFHINAIEQPEAQKSAKGFD